MFAGSACMIISCSDNMSVTSSQVVQMLFAQVSANLAGSSNALLTSRRRPPCSPNALRSSPRKPRRYHECSSQNTKASRYAGNDECACVEHQNTLTQLSLTATFAPFPPPLITVFQQSFSQLYIIGKFAIFHLFAYGVIVRKQQPGTQ